MNTRTRNLVKAMRKYWQTISLGKCTYYIPRIDKIIKIVFENEVEQ